MLAEFRYEVEDPEPESPTAESRYLLPPSAVIALPPPAIAAGPPPPEAIIKKGKKVLALYPQTSTFYEADVVEGPGRGREYTDNFW
ncbi:hypothetical protein HK097_003845 [Rhizophlyctis rosea]|uniref:SGF29 C-terminal domain-containing protein n=1 Tax=Rhizophlyctis rosea TaxID=64517 RepID=A0AAD5X7C7_9FUNG|nr:hypothetical protein HK097_003845 [Rhizophlyctis rosea]